ncbi:calcium-binding protein, partial [Thalassiosira pseudonana CCMP1335]
IAQYLESGSTKDLDTLWKILDINGDGTISPEELKQYIVESDMKSITSQEFDILYDAVDEDSNGEITYEEFTAFFCHLHESSFQDFA